MQSLEDRLVKNSTIAVNELFTQYFEAWRNSTDPVEREAIFAKTQALTDLQFELVQCIRGSTDE